LAIPQRRRSCKHRERRSLRRDDSPLILSGRKPWQPSSHTVETRSNPSRRRIATLKSIWRWLSLHARTRLSSASHSVRCASPRSALGLSSILPYARQIESWYTRLTTAVASNPTPTGRESHRTYVARRLKISQTAAFGIFRCRASNWSLWRKKTFKKTI